MIYNFLFFAMLFAIIGMSFFQFIQMKHWLTKVKLRQKRTYNELLSMQEVINALNNKIEEQHGSLKNIKIQQSAGLSSRDSIEHNYDRAKILLKRGVSDKDLLKAGLTEEEFQLIHETNILHHQMDEI